MGRISGWGKPKIGMIRFPGSNCDADCLDSLQRHFSLPVSTISHRATELPALDVVVLPGGFSYGDYLRAGALAALSPIMQAVADFRRRGGSVIGICNGFQILCETQLLPGALLDNDTGSFICRWVNLRFATPKEQPHSIKLPIAHGQGRYFASKEALKSLVDNEQILLTYEGKNPNGSLEEIAGIRSSDGRVWGMMPHPERACDKILGGEDGIAVWTRFTTVLG